MKTGFILGATVVLAGFIVGTGVGEDAADTKELDKQISKLQIARRDTYAKLADIQKERFSHGVCTISEVLNASILLTEAELEIAKTKADRIKHIRMLVDFTKKMEQDAKLRVEFEARSVELLLKAQTARMAAEIRLLKEKKAQR